MKYETDYDLYYHLGQRIKYYREKTGMTQSQLADAAQISISYLSKIEASNCHKSLSISVLNHIANILDLDITTFFGELPDDQK